MADRRSSAGRYGCRPMPGCLVLGRAGIEPDDRSGSTGERPVRDGRQPHGHETAAFGQRGRGRAPHSAAFHRRSKDTPMPSQAGFRVGDVSLRDGHATSAAGRTERSSTMTATVSSSRTRPVILSPRTTPSVARPAAAYAEMPRAGTTLQFIAALAPREAPPHDGAAPPRRSLSRNASMRSSTRATCAPTFHQAGRGRAGGTGIAATASTRKAASGKAGRSARRVEAVVSARARSCALRAPAPGRGG